MPAVRFIDMIFGAPQDRVRLGRGLCTGILAIYALLIAHDAIFLVQYGAGPDIARAMAEGGNDGYWSSSRRRRIPPSLSGRPTVPPVTASAVQAVGLCRARRRSSRQPTAAVDTTADAPDRLAFLFPIGFGAFAGSWLLAGLRQGRRRP
jgi:hypothetical protein